MKARSGLGFCAPVFSMGLMGKSMAIAHLKTGSSRLKDSLPGSRKPQECPALALYASPARFPGQSPAPTPIRNLFDHIRRHQVCATTLPFSVQTQNFELSECPTL